jgi:hypothetical protein
MVVAAIVLTITTEGSTVKVISRLMSGGGMFLTSRACLQVLIWFCSIARGRGFGLPELDDKPDKDGSFTPREVMLTARISRIKTDTAFFTGCFMKTA